MADQLTIQKRLGKLPRWAVVAFAARCARRVQPLSGDDKEARTAVDRAINLAESFAAIGDAAATARATADAVVRAAADHAGRTNSTNAVLAAADAARVAANAAAGVAANAIADVAASAAASATYAVRVADGGLVRSTAHAAALNADLTLLEQLASEHSWTDDTPVPQSVFGEMWPDGPPESWPKIRDNKDQLGEDGVLIAFAYDPEVLSEADYLKIMELLGDLARATGGKGIDRVKLSGYEATVAAGVPA